MDRSDVRRRAAALFAQGVSRAAVARAVGRCRATMTDWYRRWEDGGANALVRSTVRGRKPLLDENELQAIHRALMRPPSESGFDAEQWSLASIASLIFRHTGVHHHPRHVVRVLRRVGWVVPPVGRNADAAFRRTRLCDPEGNDLYLHELRTT